MIDLERGLLSFAGRPWTFRDSFEGTHIFGAPGSGKTTGSGRALAMAFLRAGFGGLVLTVKGDEAQVWRRYLEDAGRAHDFLRVGHDTNEHFNFLRYETSRETRGGGLTANISSRFFEAIDDQAFRSQDPYWDFALRTLLTNAIDTVLLSGDAPTLEHIHETILSAPTSEEVLTSDLDKSLCFNLLLKAEKRKLDEDDRQRLKNTKRYWRKEFAVLPEKTRTSVVSCFTARATDLMRPPLSRLFGDRGSNVVDTFPPEAAHRGKVVVLDLPILEFGAAGRFAQRLYKTAWQHATLQRAKGPDARPVFLWVDEAHHFVSEADSLFQSTCRDFRVAAVYLAQNLPNYYAFFAARDPKAATDGFLASLRTKIFHQNNDAVTNQWAEQLFGGSYPNISRFSDGGATTVPGSKPYFSAPGVGRQRQTGPEFRYNVPAVEFARLKSGGPPDHEAQTIVYWKKGEALRVPFPTPRS